MPRRLRLSVRDKLILQHVSRHGLTTSEALHARFFAEQSQEAVKSTLKRLCGGSPSQAVLSPEPLDGRRVCYRLTVQGAHTLGERRFRVRPLGNRAKAERYAVLWFICIDQPGTRSLLNPREFPDQFPLGPQRLPRAHFYLEQTPAGRAELGYLLVDYQSDPRRIVRRATDTIDRFLEQGWFDQFLSGSAFKLMLLSTSAGRARDLQQQIQRHWRAVFRHAAHLPQLAAVTVPGLADLLTQRQPPKS